MKKIIFIADLFIEDHVGGGEINNEEAIKLLTLKGYTVKKIRSHQVNPQIIEELDGFFVVGNFIGLSEASKKKLQQKKYIIYEHDHKYLKTRNPTIYKNYLSDENNLINKEFYKMAIAVLCQSKVHSEVVWKNLLIKNIINCSGNIWSKEQLDILKKYSRNEKKYEHAVLDSNNPIKNTFEAKKYCEDNKLQYKLIPFINYENYIKELSECKKFVFFPKVLETLSRTSIEAKILGCKLITSNYLGVASEEWIKKTPEEILKYVEDNNNTIVEKIVDCIESKNYQQHFYQAEKLPKVSIITSIFKGQKYIENYLSSITKQTIFDECELILINANSPEDEESIIRPYLEKYANIKYIKLDEDPGIYGCWNIGIKTSEGEYVCNSNLDDLRFIENLETLRKHLYLNKNIDLVYGDSIEVNEMPQINKQYPLKLSEHSLNDFSKENLIKCLPGALPLWKKSIHEKVGYFDEKYKSAGDWELWLRAASNGCEFKKIDAISGLYYNNPNGKSTSQEFLKEKFLEEKEIFFKYKDIFGYNYQKYLSWFSR